ncbi:hypothetical protein HPT25_15685 [Bacillus sp. BRMEA1]|uniref:hypothetical protein n=1 Tax=Neobacillus endophyticus TaxID=2738405 RepID=UPI001562F9A4|nr:hypothetical protein [Neobacillus endophyticus]NRD78803.1 hypothetical protein [Neobacillus endophyticus]
MNTITEKMLWELRQTKKEIEQSIADKQKNDWLRTLLEEELSDVNLALSKITDGNYGLCEISGELLPDELLEIFPTMRTKKDPKMINHYCKKPI